MHKWHEKELFFSERKEKWRKGNTLKNNVDLKSVHCIFYILTLPDASAQINKEKKAHDPILYRAKNLSYATTRRENLFFCTFPKNWWNLCLLVAKERRI